MWNSVLGLPHLNPEILKRRKNVLRGARTKSETKFSGEIELLILILKIMKAWSKEEARGGVRKTVSHVGKKPKMENLGWKDLTPRSLFMRALNRRIRKKRSLIDRDVIETGLTTLSLGTTAKKRK